jgi:hypothetical protein
MNICEAYKKVVEQIRRADANRQEYDEPIIEEEDINYPTLPNIDTSSIRRLRR